MYQQMNSLESLVWYPQTQTSILNFVSNFEENFSEAVRQNPECKAWDQASDQGVMLLSTASVITYAYRIIVYIFYTYCLAAAQNGSQGNMCSNYCKYSKTLCTCTDYNLATMRIAILEQRLLDRWSVTSSMHVHYRIIDVRKFTTNYKLLERLA